MMEGHSDAAGGVPIAIDRTFFALADPTRRAVIETLRRGPCRAGELASALAMTPAALSRHLKILRKGALITEDALDTDARVKLYRLERDAFSELGAWLGEVEAFWNDQLGAFKVHTERRRLDRMKK